MYSRWMIAIATLVLVHIAVACGSGSSADLGTASSASLGGTASGTPNLPLPDLGSLKQAAFTEAGLVADGAYDPLAQVFFPQFYQNVALGGTGADFTPNWGAGTYHKDNLAFALYGFIDVADFDRDKTIRMSWALHNGQDKPFIGVSNWTRDAWDWYPCDANGIVTLDASRWADYKGMFMGFQTLAFMVVVPDNGGPWQLDSCRLGAEVAPDVTGVTPDTGMEGLTLGIDTVLAGGDPLTWDWTFGAGITPSTSTDATPQITLGPAGVIACSVTVGNAAGSDTFPFNYTISPPTTAPDITAVSPTLGQENDLMTAIAINAGGPVTTWAWDFGGGATPGTSNEASPDITLGPAGLYSCNVTATNAAGFSSFDFQLDIAPPGNPPHIESLSPTTGPSGSTPFFDVVVSGGPVINCAWDFDGGASPNNPTDNLSPTVVLGAPGSYNASLTVSNTDGNETLPFTLVVTGVLAPPDITDILPISGEEFTQVQFTATNGGGPVADWLWDFGGAGTPDSPLFESPTVSLGPGGPMVYTVEVTATNAAGSDIHTIDFSIVPGGP